MATQHRPFEKARPWGATLPIVLIVATVAIGIAALLPLVQSSGVTTTGGRIWQLEQERSDWQARLQAQEVEVARLGSLERIDKEARERLKMVPPKEVHYITVDVPGPAPNRVPSRFLEDPPEEAGGGDSLWEEIGSWLPIP
jgi:hypothetical protein